MMSNSNEYYTYRAGQKINLVKRTDQFVVRTVPEMLTEIGISDAQQVSSASSRITCRTADLERLMSQSRHLAPTHHAYQIAETNQDFLITDRIFVRFHESTTPEQIDDFAGRYGLLKKNVYSGRDYLFQLTNHTGINPVKLVVKLTEEEDLVEMVDHDMNYIVQVCSHPTDTHYIDQWHLHKRLTHPEFDPRSSSQCEASWELLGSHGSLDVVIGVTDDGCKLDHHDFDSPGKFAGWGYFVGSQLVKNTDIGADPTRMYQEKANHGTSCAGVIAAEVDAVLTVGAAPGCRLFPIKWESRGPILYISDSKIMHVLDFIADKVDILSNSWGGAPENKYGPIVTERISELARTGGRRGKGIIFLWAAGNANCPIQHTTSVKVPYTPGWDWDPIASVSVWVGVKTARHFKNDLVGIPGVMHVAALASNARRSHYSNYGTGIGICAPSSNSHAYWRLPSTVKGLGITTTTGPTDEGPAIVTGGFGGTSSATPLVAGIAALVISANPELTALEVISILKRTASKDLSLEGYPRTPPAIFDPDTSWDVSPVAPFDKGDFIDTGDPDGTWSPWFGHGRVDARAAVEEALRLRSSVPISTVNYNSWIDEITIKNKHIKHVKTEYEFDNPVSSIPSGWSTSVITDTNLTDKQWEDLNNFIKNSGFENLESAYGAPENMRYYPYSLTIGWGEVKKEVLYRSNPSYGKPPEAFWKVKDYLLKLSEDSR
ncbi:MAG: S8 family serine peptidase [Okeania sp. SIO2D1]|nr:S8 family serine peptidase [Okeania sp. SIO2D1]